MGQNRGGSGCFADPAKPSCHFLQPQEWRHVRHIERACANAAPRALRAAAGTSTPVHVIIASMRANCRHTRLVIGQRCVCSRMVRFLLRDVMDMIRHHRRGHP
ncbi:MAG: hypothetical protein D6773_16970 [Alphaproteobacteria bacterium]|nr:MAG: hypothetical protein D6773_16970 [Alphaproteobacteria bacterium]